MSNEKAGTRAYAEALAQWEHDVYGPQSKKGGIDESRFATSSEIPLRPLYGPQDDGADALQKLGLPGDYPFTRGVQPTMYRGRFWTMRQYAGFGTAEETNARFRKLLDAGQMGLSTAFDLPTQMGRDSDHARAAGEVGRVGVAIDTVEDMETLFAGIPLGKVSTSMTINATAAILLGLYEEVGARTGVSASALSGTLQNDLLKEYMARGTYIYPPAPSMRLAADIIAYTAERMPKFNPISISGYHIREAGSTAAQEIAFTLADGIAYVEEVRARGLDVDAFAGRLSFFFNVHNHFLEEIAKFRAARRMWARIMKERFGAKDKRSMMLRFHAQTAGSTLTAQQPDNNVVRVALQALAAVVGGAQSLHTNGRDEALSLPTEAAAVLALRTQQIIANESGVTDIIDPFGGAWALEALTDELEAKANAYLEKIDSMGGMVEAIARGYPQREIEDAAFRAQRAVEEKKEIIVGVNEFQSHAETPFELYRVNPELEVRQKERLAAFRKRRDSDAARRAVDVVREKAKTQENLLPSIVAAVHANATLGEIADSLRDVFGEYRGGN
jgi:methylmalonyl-CoA mutase N-terminal domain/subunit